MLHTIALTQLKGIGNANAKKLIELVEGKIKDIFETKSKDLNLESSHLEKLLSEKAKYKAISIAESELKFIEKNEINPVFYKNSKYPSRVRECKDSPILLYQKGETNLNPLRSISIVGTRKPTNEGIQTTQNLIEEIADIFPNTLITSGLAYGIDVTAHKAALKNNLPTTAVLGHGLQTMYPAVHKNTANLIIENGGSLLSQYTSHTRIVPQNFIERNTIVAAMADATIIIESKHKGGSMATAHIANSYGRDVLAIPGSIHSEFSKGCNILIKKQIASLIENAEDIGYTLGWDITERDTQQSLFFDLSPEEESITNILQQEGKVSIDRVCLLLKKTTSDLFPIITQLEFKDLITSHPGKFYSLRK